MNMDIKKISQSVTIKAIIATIISLAVVAGIFQAGVFVGFHKASFLYNSGDNFYRAFGNRDDRLVNGLGFGNKMFRDEMTGGHGVIGKIIRVNLPTVTVLGPDNIEKVVLIDENTDIHEQRNISTIENLNVDKFISVIGSPNNTGQIVAKFIRIVSAPTSQFGQGQGRGFQASSTLKNATSTIRPR